MIVYIKNRRNKHAWDAECSNCGAKAVEKEIPPRKLLNSITIYRALVCPYGCVDEDTVV